MQLRVLFSGGFVGLLLWVFSYASLFAEDPVFSGPQPGEPLPKLEIQLVLADPPTETINATEVSEQTPYQLVIFVHQLTRPSVAFARTLGDYAASRKKDGLKSTLVFLGEDATALAAQVRRARHALPQQVVTGISTEGIEGPGSFGLNRNVTLTVLLANKGEVSFNQALVDPSLPVELPKTLQAICDLTGGEPPSVERLLARNSAAMRGNQRGAATEDRPPGFDQVEPLLRRLIRKDASQEDVDMLAKQIDVLLEKHPQSQARVKQIAGRVHQIYGTERAQYHLRRWAGIKSGEEKVEPPQEGK